MKKYISCSALSGPCRLIVGQLTVVQVIYIYIYKYYSSIILVVIIM